MQLRLPCRLGNLRHGLFQRRQRREAGHRLLHRQTELCGRQRRTGHIRRRQRHDRHVELPRRLPRLHLRNGHVVRLHPGLLHQLRSRLQHCGSRRRRLPVVSGKHKYRSVRGVIDRQRRKVRLHAGHVDGLPPRFGRGGARALLCAATRQALHPERIHDAATDIDKRHQPILHRNETVFHRQGQSGDARPVAVQKGNGHGLHRRLPGADERPRHHLHPDSRRQPVHAEPATVPRRRKSGPEDYGNLHFGRRHEPAGHFGEPDHIRQPDHPQVHQTRFGGGPDQAARRKRQQRRNERHADHEGIRLHRT